MDLSMELRRWIRDWDVRDKALILKKVRDTTGLLDRIYDDAKDLHGNVDEDLLQELLRLELPASEEEREGKRRKLLQLDLETFTIPQEIQEVLDAYVNGRLKLKFTEKNVPVFKKQPCMLLYKLHEANNYSLLKEVVQKAAGNRFVLVVGTSGCGKTRSIYELFAQEYGIYFVVSTEGNGGSDDISAMIDRLNGIVHRDGKEKNLYLVQVAVLVLLIARFCILKFCIDAKAKAKADRFTAYEWLILQVAWRGLLSTEDHNIESEDVFSLMFSSIWVRLQDMDQGKWSETLMKLFNVFARDCQKACGMFPHIAIDEAQLLMLRLQGHFFSENSQGGRPLAKPMIQFMMAPTPEYQRHMVLFTGTGLTLLAKDYIVASGVGKRANEVVKFCEFGSWRDEQHIKEYAASMLELTDDDCSVLFSRFKGRYRPLVLCLEEMLNGKSCTESMDFVEGMLTERDQGSGFGKTYYGELKKIADGERPGFVNNVNVLDVCMKAIIQFNYFGSSFYLMKGSMEVVEAGLGRLKISENGNQGAFIDEPLVVKAIKHFFSQGDQMKEGASSMLASLPYPPAQGLVWQHFVPDDICQSINEWKGYLLDMPILKELDLPESLKTRLKKRATIQRGTSIPLVCKFSKGYKLRHYLEDNKEQSGRGKGVFMVCEDSEGPDLATIIDLDDGSRINLFCQLKFCKQVSKMGDAMKKSAPSSKDVWEVCQDLVLCFLIMYPAERSRKLRPTYEVCHGRKVFRVVIDKSNADSLFRADHLSLLNSMKDSCFGIPDDSCSFE